VSASDEAAARLADQLGFVLEVDRLKSVIRRGYVADGSRRENTAEHSWTLALMALVLAEHAAEPVDVATVVRMVVIHDLVEVDAGDTYVYDDAGRASKDARERAAADRLYGLLPADQGAELRALWDEFEHGTSPEARFARSVDRFAGFLLNHASGGWAWRENDVAADRVHAVNQAIEPGSPALWAEVQRRLVDALDRGWIEPGSAGPAPDQA
jgi:5'-deoxynucleotidase YfbR-like HD superfamily hydrolase